MKQHFPLLANRNITYLDSAAMTQKPKIVIDAITKYYSEENANIHRGLYELSIQATQKYEDARETVARFIGAQSSEIIFTKSTTESLNALAHMLPPLFAGRKDIILTELEHHSNIVPWQELAKRNGLTIKYIRITPDGELDYAHAAELITSNTALVSITHVSNALGTSIDLKRITSLARNVGALSIIDAAQSIAHQPIDVKEIDCDFLTFSGHKAYGPTGIGVLYGKKEHLSRMQPYQHGGGMIRTVTLDSTTYLDPPHRFEAGTPHIAGAIGLAAALDFITSIGWETILHHEQTIMHALKNALAHNPRVHIRSPQNAHTILSFEITGAHPHDVADILGKHGVCIRAGHHCAMPLMTTLGVPGLCRVSIGMHTTTDDINALTRALGKVTEVFT